MHQIDLYQKRDFVFSIEVFPPKTENGMEKLKTTLEKLAQTLIKHESDSEVSKNIYFQHVEKQIEELLQEGVEGLHLYALNSLETIDRLEPKLKEASGI